MAETVKTALRMGSNIEFLASARASEAITESGMACVVVSK